MHAASDKQANGKSKKFLRAPMQLLERRNVGRM